MDVSILVAQRQEEARCERDGDGGDAYRVSRRIEGARAMIITAIIAVFGKLLVSGRPGT